MTSKTHIAGGVLIASAILSYKQMDMVHIFSGAILGNVLPDMDTEQSWISQTIPWIDDTIRMISRGAKGKSKKVHNTLKHRGILTHSIVTIIISCFVLYVFRNVFTLGIVAGIVSHLVLDWVTKIGIVTTGKKSEDVAYNLIWVVDFMLIWRIWR